MANQKPYISVNWGRIKTDLVRGFKSLRRAIVKIYNIIKEVVIKLLLLIQTQLKRIEKRYGVAKKFKKTPLKTKLRWGFLILIASVMVGLIVFWRSEANRHAEETRLREAQIEQVELEKTEVIETLEEKQQRLREVEADNVEKQKKIEQQEKDLQAKLQREEAERLARIEAERLATSQPAQINTASYTVGGNKDSWLAASGIPSSQWGAVDFIVSRESGWNPNAVNPSSGACGLGQQLPCGKWSGAWNDPVAALQNQYAYVNDRYGGYHGAVAFWQANKWY